MNYIRHLTAFLQKVKTDDRLNSSHISLYLALFHYWNLNMFENPLSVNRAQMLELSKIGSQHTYYKCLKELHSFGYIRYNPSHHPSKGCLVSLCTFDITPVETCANMHNSGDPSAAKMHNHGCKNDLTLAANMQPSINNINNKTYCSENTSQDPENINPEKEPGDQQFQKESRGPDPEALPVRIAPEKDEKEFRNSGRAGKDLHDLNENSAVGGRDKIPPDPNQVKTFFKNEDFPEVEAQKFFNHFQSNGWKVGGRSPMKDWHAAARNWMLNCQKFANPAKPKSTNLNTNKRYAFLYNPNTIIRSIRRSRKQAIPYPAGCCLSKVDAGDGASLASQEFLVPFFDKKGTYK